MEMSHKKISWFLYGILTRRLISINIYFFCFFRNPKFQNPKLKSLPLSLLRPRNLLLVRTWSMILLTMFQVLMKNVQKTPITIWKGHINVASAIEVSVIKQIWNFIWRQKMNLQCVKVAISNPAQNLDFLITWKRSMV